ncbi:FAD-dependent oxidoreductase [Glutamicibacter sp.]|uniref:FAD-dependent oxidoreductase n=1 Tax=Glutamicibacter sp. TaxID=1931995 RepID=UPI0028BEB9BF|nr:FAD-dependent oxidoreductase [Glutamicibacter sp.]
MSPIIHVAVIGAGPAGLAAVANALAHGAQVTCIDANDQPGGQYWRHRLEQPGAPTDSTGHHDWSTYLLLRAAFDQGLAEGTLTHLPNTQVWMAQQQEDGRITLQLTSATAAGAQAQVAALSVDRLVVATGAYDRQIPIPGWDLPGVMTAGAVQALIKGQGVLAGQKVVLAGTGPFLLPVASNVAHAGGTVAAICESADLSGWLKHPTAPLAVPAKGIEGAEYAWDLLRHRIPYKRRTVITKIHGTDTVEAVSIARTDKTGKIIAGSEERIENVDCVGLGFGFTTQLELLTAFGVATHVDVDGSLVADVDEFQLTSGANILAAGEVTGIGGAALAVAEGTVAGYRAALHAGQAPQRSEVAKELKTISRHRAFARAMHQAHPVPDYWGENLEADTVVCRCEEVTAGEIIQARDELKAVDARSIKSTTRAGMGWCQGRVCGYAASCLATGGDKHERFAHSVANTYKRPVSIPVPLGEIADLEDSPKE